MHLQNWAGVLLARPLHMHGARHHVPVAQIAAHLFRFLGGPPGWQQLGNMLYAPLIPSTPRN
jgi:hypothetical protein